MQCRPCQWPVSWAWSASICTRGFCHFFFIHLLSLSLIHSAFSIKLVVFLTMNSRICSDHKWNCWHIHIAILCFLFLFVCLLSSIKICEEKKEFERWLSEMRWGNALLSNITYSTKYFFSLLFCSQLLWAVVLL